MDYYAQKRENTSSDLLISLNAVVDFTTASPSLNAYLNQSEEVYKNLVLNASLRSNYNDLSKVNSLMSLPPRPFAIDVLKRILQNEQFKPYFLYPVRNCDVKDYYPKMRNWFMKYFCKELKEKVLITSADNVSDGCVFIESHTTSLLSGNAGLYIKLGSQQCLDWKTVDYLLARQYRERVSK